MPEPCLSHQWYRSEMEAMARATEHASIACWKCRTGLVFHVFRCDKHWHCGHASIRAMAGVR